MNAQSALSSDIMVKNPFKITRIAAGITFNGVEYSMRKMKTQPQTGYFYSKFRPENHAIPISS
jgi:hypothetical protein